MRSSNPGMEGIAQALASFLLLAPLIIFGLQMAKLTDPPAAMDEIGDSDDDGIGGGENEATCRIVEDSPLLFAPICQTHPLSSSKMV